MSSLKLADFGFCIKYKKVKKFYSLGTPGYIAPEIMHKNAIHTPKVDIFSCGCALFMM